MYENSVYVTPYMTWFALSLVATIIVFLAILVGTKVHRNYKQGKSAPVLIVFVALGIASFVLFTFLFTAQNSYVSVQQVHDSSQPPPVYVTHYMTWFALSLVATIIVFLAILVGTKVHRNYKQGKNAPALVVSVALGVASFILFAFFFTARSSYVSVQQVHNRSQQLLDVASMNRIQTIKVNQSRSTIVNSPPQFNPLFEQPVVARKPNQVEVNSSASQVKQEKSPSEPLPKWVLSGLEEGNQSRRPVVQTGLFMDEGMQNPYLVSGRMVFQSGLFATREEAMENALSKATQKLQSNLESSNEQYRHSGWVLSPGLVRQTAYRKIHYQTVEHDFGNLLKSGKPFKQDMYRAYLEVEDTLPVRTTILKKWRKDIGNKRTAWLGGGFGVVTFMCVFVAIYLRATHDQTTNKPTNY